MRAPTTASTTEIRSPDEHGIPDPVSTPRPGTVRMAVVATVVGLFVFLVVQGLLAAYNLDVMRDAVDRGWLDVARGDPVRQASVSLGYAGVSYLMLALAGSAIAGRGHRLLFALPAIALIFISVIPSPHQPHAIGLEWAIPCYGPTTCSWPWFAHPLVGAFVDLALVLAPGAVVARSVPKRRWPGSTDAPDIAAILTAAATAGTAWWALASIEPYVDPAMLGTVAVFGLVLGVTWPW
jgi:hypothetical protein